MMVYDGVYQPFLMVYTTHKNGDEWGMVYDIAIPTLVRLLMTYPTKSDPQVVKLILGPGPCGAVCAWGLDWWDLAPSQLARVEESLVPS